MNKEYSFNGPGCPNCDDWMFPFSSRRSRKHAAERFGDLENEKDFQGFRGSSIFLNEGAISHVVEVLVGPNGFVVALALNRIGELYLCPECGRYPIQIIHYGEVTTKKLEELAA